MNLSKDMKRSEIEAELSKHGDFVQIDILNRFQNQVLTGDLKRFVHLKLLEIYTKKGMYRDAARMADNLAIGAPNFEEKRACYLREIELYVKAGIFDRASVTIKKVLSESSDSQKEEVSKKIKEFYIKQAEIFTKEKQRRKAAEIYEKVLEMNISEVERQELRERLMELYDKLGKIKEYFQLKNS